MTRTEAKSSGRPVSRLRERGTEHHPRGQGSERVAGHRVALGHEQRQQRPARREGEIDVSPSDEESEADQWHAETDCDLGQADDRARTEQTEEAEWGVLSGEEGRRAAQVAQQPGWASPKQNTGSTLARQCHNP